MKLIFFGDSLTEGRYGGSYFEHIQTSYPQHEMINAGQGGNTILNLAERLERDVLDKQPDGVFMMVGGNDAISYSQPGSRVYYRQVQNIPDGIVSPEMFSTAYRQILESLSVNYIQTWVGLPPAEYNPEVVQAQRQYNQLAADVARSLNIPTLDLMSEFAPAQIPQRPPIDLGFINLIGKRQSSGWDDYEAEQKRQGYTYTFDGLHLIPASAIPMAKLIADFIGL